jgi:hypothetical protein
MHSEEGAAQVARLVDEVAEKVHGQAVATQLFVGA